MDLSSKKELKIWTVDYLQDVNKHIKAIKADEVLEKEIQLNLLSYWEGKQNVLESILMEFYLKREEVDDHEI